jgi:hypothetical protein
MQSCRLVHESHITFVVPCLVRGLSFHVTVACPDALLSCLHGTHEAFGWSRERCFAALVSGSFFFMSNFGSVLVQCIN